MDSHLILDLDQWAVELGMSTVYSLGNNGKRTPYDRIPS